MAVASGLAGLVLARPVFTVFFGTAHPQIMNNTFWAALTTSCRRPRMRHTQLVPVPRHDHSNWQYH